MYHGYQALRFTDSYFFKHTLIQTGLATAVDSTVVGRLACGGTSQTRKLTTHAQFVYSENQDMKTGQLVKQVLRQVRYQQVTATTIRRGHTLKPKWLRRAERKV